MVELIPYIFEHPQYGTLRVVVEEGRIYYDLFDVKEIFLKKPLQLYQVIADSEGELKNFNVVMKPAKKNQHNLFYSDDIMGVAMISDNTILEPINIYMDVAGRLIINDQIFD